MNLKIDYIYNDVFLVHLFYTVTINLKYFIKTNNQQKYILLFISFTLLCENVTLHITFESNDKIPCEYMFWKNTSVETLTNTTIN